MIGHIKSTLKSVRDVVKLYVNNYNDAIYRDWFFKHRKRLLKFKDIHKGQDCFIIGNGPSLNKMDLDPLKNYHTFGLNKIYLMFRRVDLNLSYHVAVNPLVIEQSVREFESLSCPSFLSYRPAKDFIRHYNHIYPIITGGPYTFSENLLDSVCEGHTVTYVAMQIAYYMGFERVFLIGVDHNFVADGNPNEKQILKGDDMNHFAPDYFGNKEWHLPDLDASELSYHLAKFHFNRAGRQIYDATNNGKLECFPKIPFDEALRICREKSD